MNDIWCQTYSGAQFFFDPDQPKAISILDIGRSLSRINRYLGHSIAPVSVAEHSVIVSQIVEAEGGTAYQQLLGLLHDAHEAYVGDVSSPLKAYLQHKYNVDLGGFGREIQRQIYKALEIKLPDPGEMALIDRADLYALKTERDLFLRGPHRWFCDHIKPPEYVYGFYGNWGDDEAFRYFERAYETLRSAVDFQEKIKEDLPVEGPIHD